MSSVDKDSAVFNPAEVFLHPKEILDDSKVQLSTKEKVTALKTWKYDIQLNQMAEEENMHMDSPHSLPDEILLEEINQALTKLESK